MWKRPHAERLEGAAVRHKPHQQDANVAHHPRPLVWAHGVLPTSQLMCHLTSQKQEGQTNKKVYQKLMFRIYNDLNFSI